MCLYVSLFIMLHHYVFELDESFEWISTEWLMQWLKSNATDLIPPISNISLLCKHGWLGIAQ